MEEAAELVDYLPLSFKTESNRQYVQFLWEAFESNYENKKNRFAFLAYRTAHAHDEFRLYQYLAWPCAVRSGRHCYWHVRRVCRTMKPPKGVCL